MLKNNKTLFVLSAVFVIAATRILPHPPNFTAVGALAIFGGAMLKDKYLAFLAPLLALWISDLAINNLIYGSESFVWIHSGFYWTYIPFVLMVAFGGWFVKKVSVGRVVGSSLIASLLFFVVSNFGAWLASPVYSKTLGGLAAAYTAGIPFFTNTALGDLFFCAVLFGGFALAERSIPALRKAEI